MAPSRDIRIGRYSKNTKFYARIVGKSFQVSQCTRRTLRTHVFPFKGDDKLTYASQLAPRCFVPESVPKTWCFKQFYNMCRNSKKKNATVLARYGSAGCQQWQLLEKDYNIPSGKNS
jgi:hypothetical protein